LEKRATVIEQIREKEKNVLLLDAGDILNIGINPRRHRYIVETYNFLKYDAWVPGDQDFIEGPDFFLNRLLQSKMTFVNTNIKTNGVLQGSRYKIKKFGELTIGITGTIDQNLHKYLAPSSRKFFKFENQEKSLSPVINELSEKCDFIILLSHSGFENDKFLAERFPEIGLIIGGHSQILINDAEKVGPTLIVQLDGNAYRLGVLHLYFENRKLNMHENKIILLDKKINNQPQVMKIIKEYSRK